MHDHGIRKVTTSDSRSIRDFEPGSVDDGADSFHFLLKGVRLAQTAQNWRFMFRTATDPPVLHAFTGSGITRKGTFDVREDGCNRS